MIARCLLFTGDELEMLAEDEADVQRIGREIAMLQAQYGPAASMLAQMDRMGSVLKKVLPDVGEDVPLDAQAAETFAEMMAAQGPPPEYHYTKPDGLPGVLEPVGWGSVMTVEAVDDQVE